MEWVEVKTFTPWEVGRQGGSYSSVKIPASAHILRLEKIHWSNEKQDWRVQIHYSNGAVIDSDTWWKDYNVTS